MRGKSVICQIHKRFIIFFICTALFFCNSIVLTASAEEKSQIIKVGIFPYEDQLTMDSNGNYSGYGYDYLQEISHYTGWQYEYIKASWEECLDMLAEGKIDLLGAVMHSPKREEIFDFADLPMISGYGVLATSLDNTVLPYEDYKSFDGLKTGALKGNLHAETFLAYSRTHGFTPIIKEYDSQTEMDAALEKGEISAEILTNLLHSEKMRVIAAFGENDGYFAVTKGNISVLDPLNAAMRQIRLKDPYFNNKLDQKYYDLQTATAISFSREELDFIKNCPPIPCTYIPDATPITYYNETAKSVQGIAVDVCKLLEERTGLSFTWLHPASASEAAAMLRRGDALLLPAKYYDSNWAQQNDVLLTSPYLLGQMVMTTGRPDSEPKVVALYDQGSQSRLVANVVSSNAQLKQYNTIIDCMDAVLSKEADATFINSTIASYLMNNPKYAQLHTTPLYGFSADVSMSVSSKANPLLLSILNKGLQHISSTEINQIVLSQMKTEQASRVAAYLYLHPIEVIFLVISIFLVLVLILLFLLCFLLKNSQKMRKTLYTDALTGHPNYHFLSLEVKDLIGNHPENYALVYLDIHHFKAINDTFGYETGDLVLIAVSDVLERFVGTNERTARIYADTFVLLLCYTTHEELRIRLDNLSEQLNQIKVKNENTINLLFCGGIYPLPNDFDGLDKACDRANYAKDSITQYYSNTFIFYDDLIRNRILYEKELEGSMLSALNREEFIPFYQPKVNAITGKVIGAEALVRWQHPQKGILPPSEFLPFYEKNGFIVKIDLFIFEQVCRHLQQWLKKDNKAVPVSVNFSRRNMLDSDLPRKLKNIADRYQIPTSLLEIEVTETEELQSMEAAVDFVEALKSYGFSVSIDDYGTGYSSISFLQQLPLDALKLDRMFILNAMKTDRARDIMRYLVTAMQKNEIRVVCEGIETDEQRDFIITLNCRYIQGYLYSTPLYKDDFEVYLLKHGAEISENLDFIPIANFEKNLWNGTDTFLTKAIPSWIAATRLEPDYPIHYISPNFLEEMGYSELEFSNMTNGLYINWVHPDDIAHLQDLLEHYKRSHQDSSLQYRLRKKNGTYLWIKEINKRIITDDGFSVLLSVCTNITDIVDLQMEKSRLIDTIPGGVGELFLTEEGPVIKHATERFYSIINYTPEEMAAIGNNFFHILCRQDLPKAMDILSQFLESNLSFCECTFRIQHKDGSPHWVAFHGTISHTQPDRLITVVIYDNDVEMRDKQNVEIAHAKLELALDLTGQAVFEYDLTSDTISSQGGFPMFNIPNGTAIDISRTSVIAGYVHPDEIGKLENTQREIAAGTARTSYEIRMRSNPADSNSPYTWIRITLSTIFDEEHHPVRAIGVVEDINQQKHFEHAFLQESQYRKALTDASLMAYEINLTSDMLQRLTGSRVFRLEDICKRIINSDRYSEVLPLAAEFLVTADDRIQFMEELSRDSLLNLFYDGITEKELEYRRLTLDGQELWNSVLIYMVLDQLTGDVIGYAYHRDIQQQKELEKELMEQASHDSLTGISNRTAAEHLIQDFLLHNADSNCLQAFLMLDINHFKEINDTYGHLTGDKCLIRFAEIIKEYVRSEDIVARMGGDEFAILLKNLDDKRQAEVIARQIVQAVPQIGIELGFTLKTSVSIGLSLSPDHGTNFEQLYRHADHAMYDAKRSSDTHIIWA